MCGSLLESIAALIVEARRVDKIVGDAVRALFRPSILRIIRAQRSRARSRAKLDRVVPEAPGPAAIRFGRTRIGIEAGEAIVGDVGLRSKLDYTAYGDAVNAAARLEAANKELGSSICIGPAAAARCDPTLLRPLGTIVVRGRDEPLAVFDARASAQWRGVIGARSRWRSTIRHKPLPRSMNSPRSMPTIRCRNCWRRGSGPGQRTPETILSAHPAPAGTVARGRHLPAAPHCVRALRESTFPVPAAGTACAGSRSGPRPPAPCRCSRC